MRYLYDADASIDYLQDVTDARTTFERLLPDGIACSVVTQIELYTGVYTSSDPKAAERQLKAFMAVVTTLPLNQKVVRQAARLRSDLVARRLSFRSRAYDLIVAATGLAYQLTVITSNTDDYRVFPGLATLDPRTGVRQSH
jgi:predicted nucleic acid-binding protein